jgi:dienelactone hydrolase
VWSPGEVEGGSYRIKQRNDIKCKRRPGRAEEVSVWFDSYKRVSDSNSYNTREVKFCVTLYTILMDISIPHHEHSLEATSLIGKSEAPVVIFLCGGSLEVGKERFFDWQTKLQAKGVSSVAFNYSGVPGTKETISSSSLASRTSEVLSVIDWVKREWGVTSVTLCGVSMGGHIALTAASLREVDIKSLILLAPAAYAEEAEAVTFGDDFTAILQCPDSWNNSAAFTKLAEWSKPVLFFKLEQDEVIPVALTERYVAWCDKNPQARVVRIDAPHQCWGNKPISVAARQQMIEAITDFIK